MGFAQTAAASMQLYLYMFARMQLTYRFVSACIISTASFYRESAAAKICGQNHSNRLIIFV